MNKPSGGNGIQVELFQIWKDEAVKVLHSICQQFGKLNSGHRTGKGKFSFQSQRREMPKNVPATVPLPSFHMLVRLCSKSFKLGFRSTWTENLQMYKLGLERQRRRRPDCQHHLDHRKKAREFQKNILFCFTDCAKAFGCVYHNILWNILKEMGIPDHLTCTPEKSVCWTRNNS